MNKTNKPSIDRKIFSFTKITTTIELIIDHILLCCDKNNGLLQLLINQHYKTVHSHTLTPKHITQFTKTKINMNKL